MKILDYTQISSYPWLQAAKHYRYMCVCVCVCDKIDMVQCIIDYMITTSSNKELNCMQGLCLGYIVGVATQTHA